MKWFEPIIIIIAVLLVIIPFAREFYKASKHKSSCTCGCGACGKKDKCLCNFKKIVKEEEQTYINSSK